MRKICYVKPNRNIEVFLEFKNTEFFCTKWFAKKVKNTNSLSCTYSNITCILLLFKRAFSSLIPGSHKQPLLSGTNRRSYGHTTIWLLLRTVPMEQPRGQLQDHQAYCHILSSLNWMKIIQKVGARPEHWTRGRQLQPNLVNSTFFVIKHHKPEGKVVLALL